MCFGISSGLCAPACVPAGAFPENYTFSTFHFSGDYYIILHEEPEQGENGIIKRKWKCFLLTEINCLMEGAETVVIFYFEDIWQQIPD